MLALLAVLAFPSAAPAAAAAAAALDASRAGEVRPRPAPERVAPGRGPLPGAPAARPGPGRTRLVWAGRVTARVESRIAGIQARLSGQRARKAYDALRAALRAEREQVRQDRARALMEMRSAPAGSVEKGHWSSAVGVGTAMLAGYSDAFVLLDAADPRR